MMFRKLCLLFILCLGCGSKVFAVEDAASVYDLPLQFKDQNGKQFKFSQLKGQKIAMTMVYTSCPHACPLILKRMKSLQKKSGDSGRAVKFIVVTFDPKRDTTKKLKQTQLESKEMSDWIFLNGRDQEIRQLSMVLGIRFEKNPEDGNFSHDNKIVILNEQGRIQKELNGLNADPEDSL